MNLHTHIDDLEAENAVVNINDPDAFDVDHFEREGDTTINFGEQADHEFKQKVLD